MKKLHCIICGKPLGNGIMINGNGVCLDCEKRIVNTDMNTDFYRYYKNCIKKYMIYPMIRGEDNNCQNYHL